MFFLSTTFPNVPAHRNLHFLTSPLVEILLVLPMVYSSVEIAKKKKNTFVFLVDDQGMFKRAQFLYDSHSQ